MHLSEPSKLGRLAPPVRMTVTIEIFAQILSTQTELLVELEEVS